jgi:hypothetical protein
MLRELSGGQCFIALVAEGLQQAGHDARQVRDYSSEF